MMVSSHSIDVPCLCDTATEHEHVLLYGILSVLSRSASAVPAHIIVLALELGCPRGMGLEPFQ